MNIDALIFLASSVFGIQFLIFGLPKLLKFKIPIQNSLINIVIGLIIIIFDSVESATAAVFVGGVSFVTVVAIAHSIRRIRANQNLLSKLLELIDHQIIAMKSGKSFSKSIKSFHTSNNDIFSSMHTKLVQSVFFKQHFCAKTADKRVNFYFNELFSVSNLSIRRVERLLFLRKRLKMEIDFRRRSREKLSVVVIQLVVLSFFYTAILFYHAFQPGFFQNLRLILLSIALFALGLLIAALIFRRFSDFERAN